MPGSGERAYQIHLDEQVPKEIWYFATGVVIYPHGSSRGVLRNVITAEDTNKKRGRCCVFKSLCRIDLYFDHHYWSLDEGVLFEAYKSQGHKKTIT